MNDALDYATKYEIELYGFMKTENISDMDVYRANYVLEWNEIINEYLAVGIGDIPHFASQYVFAKALNNGLKTEREEMQTMYLDIVKGVNALVASGELPKTI